MDFTRDWFSHNIPVWETHLQPLAGGAIQALEIGCFEGRATRWLLENVLTHTASHITCCDTFEGAMEHLDGTCPVDLASTERIFEQQVMAPFPGKVTKIKATSFDALTAIQRESPTTRFDLVYIDGSHVAADVMSDALLSWRLLDPGGILIFDDYEWNLYPDPALTPKVAIEAFLILFHQELRVLHRGYQIILQRVPPQRAPLEPPLAPVEVTVAPWWHRLLP